LEEGKAIRYDITTGIQDNQAIALLTDLPEGATVITGPYDLISRKLEDGDAVESKKGSGPEADESGFSVSISTN
jgi:HlyD family secretion protein